MALYTAQSRERVREAVDFVELVSARTELRRAGPSRYEGLCPFHEERTPSFGIDPAQKVYHCFGCQASGDVFTFVQETEGVDFKGALELLADRYSIELEREQEDPREAQQRQRRERLLGLLSRTALYYQRVLWESEEAGAARAYLQGRGLSEEMLREFLVGYAPSGWDRVLLASRRGGYSEQELYATGLAQRSRENGRPYDRFRGRIMFPLADMRGRVLGFGARAMRDGQGPKYLNTADNEIYHKGLHLYGAGLARAHAARAGRVILCEGYTDVIALHQAGIRNAVGLMGTALTEDQVGQLARMASTVLLALDSDSAGLEAMLRAARAAAQRRLELRVVVLPEGADPADLIQSAGAEAVHAAVEASVPFVRFRVERALSSGDDSTAEGRDRILEELRPVFAAVPPSAMRMDLTRLVSGRLGLPESLAERLLGDRAAGGAGGGAGAGDAGAVAARGRRAAGPPADERGADVLARREETERAFLALCIASPDAGAVALEGLEPAEHFTGDVLRRAAEHLSAGRLREPLAGVSQEDEALARLLAELVVEAGREQGTAVVLQAQRLQLELARVERMIQEARAAGAGDVSELAARRAEVKMAFDRAQEAALEQTASEPA